MANKPSAGFQQTVPMPTAQSIGSPVVAYEGDVYGEQPPGGIAGAIALVDMSVAKGAFIADVNQENASATNVNPGTLPFGGLVLRSNSTSFGFGVNPNGVPADQAGYSMQITSGLGLRLMRNGSAFVKIDIANENAGASSQFGSAVWSRNADGALITQVKGTAVAGATLTPFTVGSMGATVVGALCMITTVNAVA